MSVSVVMFFIIQLLILKDDILVMSNKFYWESLNIILLTSILLKPLIFN